MQRSPRFWPGLLELEGLEMDCMLRGYFGPDCHLRNPYKQIDSASSYTRYKFVKDWLSSLKKEPFLEAELSVLEPVLSTCVE